MKIVTFLGTRPEIIRLSRIIPKLDKVCTHIVAHTGQNYDKNLSDIFFEELNLRQPDYYMGAKGSMGEQIAIIIKESEVILKKERPDKVLILGDTNSGLVAYVAERMGIPVYHMEAGNRCHDKRVPEEINRKVIDHVSTYNFPYTPNSRENLLREGIDNTKIIVSGNPIYEVLSNYQSYIYKSKILKELKLKENKYFLATFHRAETVDYVNRLQWLIQGLDQIACYYHLPVVCSIHPRTRNKLQKWDIKTPMGLKFIEPVGFFDFIKLEQNAKCILSDSGTVCEEACILGVPHAIMRDTTERPETVRVGASIISGVEDSWNIFKCTKVMLDGDKTWKQPEGYIDENVSDKIVKYLIGKI